MKTKHLLWAVPVFFILIVLLPLIFVRHTGNLQQKKPQPQITEPTIINKPINVYIKKEDKVAQLDYEEYIKGVVAAEMPAAFHIEALKAQAVAARSYVYSRVVVSKGDAPEHKGAPICTDSKHCCAWISRQEAFNNWKGEANNNWSKIEQAVNSTKGEILEYNRVPISAVFHSSSDGKTENAADVWGSSVPYLKSVESPGDSVAPKFMSVTEVPVNDFIKHIKEANSKASFSKNIKDDIKDIIRTEGGYVKELKIGGVLFKGTDIRSMFSLRSHSFTIEIKEEKVIFNVKGYGHGVGMSQWGAKYLAEAGKSYIDILKTYYSQVEIVRK